MSPVGGHTEARLDGSSLCPRSLSVDVPWILHIVVSGQSSLSRAISQHTPVKIHRSRSEVWPVSVYEVSTRTEELSESEDRRTPFNKFAAQAELYRA